MPTFSITTRSVSATIDTGSSSWRTTTNAVTDGGTSTGDSVTTVGTTTVSAESTPFTKEPNVSSRTGTSTQDAGTITMLERTVGTSSLISKSETSAGTSTGDVLTSAMTTVDSSQRILTATTNSASTATSSSTGGPTNSLTTSPDAETTTGTRKPFPTTSSGTMMPEVTTTSGMSTPTAATGSETQTALKISATTTTKQTLTSTSPELSNTATSPVTLQSLTEVTGSRTSTADATTASETATADVSTGTPTKTLTDPEMPTFGITTTSVSATIETGSSSLRTTTYAVTDGGKSTGDFVTAVGSTIVRAESTPFTTEAKVSSSTGTSTQDAGTITMLETTVGTSSLISKPETSAGTSTGDALTSRITEASSLGVFTATASTGGPTDSLTSPGDETTTSRRMPFPTTSSGTMMPVVTTASGMSRTSAATGSETLSSFKVSATTTTKQTLTGTSPELSNTATSPVTSEPQTDGRSSKTSTPDAMTTAGRATVDVSTGIQTTKSLTASGMPTRNSPGSASSPPVTTILTQSANHTQNMTLAFLEAVLDKDFSPSAVGDEEFLLWLRLQLRPLLVNLAPTLVIHLFSIVKNRSCNSSQEMISVLETVQMTLSGETKAEIYKNMILFLQDQTPLKCYSGGSFYIFLKNNFLSFGFPDVPSFISLLPPTRKSELLNTISTSELSQFLNQPGAIGNSSGICVIFSNYNNTPSFLENEDVPDDVRRIILPCVWPLALSSNRRSEVDLWFNVRLRNYLRFLTKDLISFNKVQNSSCLSFQRLVSFMGKNFTYTGSDFGQPDVYAIIRSYLGAESVARCYNPTDPDLNSTSWFVNYIGTFVIFITLDDFKGFVNTSQLNVFLENKANLELFNNAAIPRDVTNYYILQLYVFYPSFGLIMLPGSLLCSPDIPSSLFASLNEADTMAILDKLKTFCNSTENPERSAALASNIKVITAQTFADLGSASSGLTNGQILSAPPAVLVSSLSTLGSVNTWGQDQASNIIHSIISSGFQINSSASLASLGTLIIGVPSKSIDSISASEALSASKNPTLVSNMLQAPKVVQEIFVKKIISVDSSPAKVVENVPDALATEIPPSLLAFSGGTANITLINQKTWTADQSTMFFATVAEADFDTEQLSPFVLQGFTCGTVKKMTKAKISQLIHACRPRKGRAKVELKEPQLTCMYNLIRGDLSQNFIDYPSDMLLYLDSKNVQKANCRSYFSALGATDFSVASSILNKGPQKFREARDCLGISDVSLSRDNVEVLGNMVCSLDRADIENSDPLILEKLKACKDLSASQVAAVETLLLSGKTQYGAVTSWDQQTLEGLGTLPLYLTRNIWTHFTATTKKRFLKGFMPDLRKRETQKDKLKTLFSELIPTVAERGAGCSEGNITQVTISDPSFPFGYNQLQFELCLDVPILKDNLRSICQKVDDDGYQRIILNKLNQAFPSGVPDQEVQMLASVSRSATLDDISKWNITELDTLAALMNITDGTWKTAQSKAIITKYLTASGKSLDSSELNIIGSNLCSLDTSTLQTITPDSMRNTKHLDVASCSTEQKRVLYEISNTSFSIHRDNPISFFNLVKGYLGGAPQADIAALSTQNISMDVNIFRSLDINVITNLTVANVQGLMGENLQDLKLFENDTVVQRWVNLQLQSDLDTLGLGLITTRADPTNGTEPQGNTNSSSTTTASTATPSQSATTSGVLEFTKLPVSVLLTALLTAALQIILQPA